MKRRNPEVASLAYMILKDVGICVRCQAQWALKGYVHCSSCREYWQVYTEERAYQKKREAKLDRVFVLKRRRA